MKGYSDQRINTALKSDSYASMIFTMMVVLVQAPDVSPSSDPAHLTLKHYPKKQSNRMSDYETSHLPTLLLVWTYS